MKPTQDAVIGIVGAGAMGQGIAQIAAVAGLEVRLIDIDATASARARAAIGVIFEKLATKGKLTSEQAQAALNRIRPGSSVTELADCDLVVEAIVEKLEVKRALFAQLEQIVRDDTVLVSNTSSLSITAIAAGCRHPERVAGYHFFNPVPLMKVVEVVRGLRSTDATIDWLVSLAARLEHTAVRCRDMPGFIVNHAGRALNTEGLRIVQEGVTDESTVDSIVREQMGFRMGPFELLDLTGLDVSHPVMESIYRQFYDEPRFRPSPITAIRLAGGMLGRKSGSGFYEYEGGDEGLGTGFLCRSERTAWKAAAVWVSARHPDEAQSRARFAPRRWTSKSRRVVVTESRRLDRRDAARTRCDLLRDLGSARCHALWWPSIRFFGFDRSAATRDHADSRDADRHARTRSDPVRDRWRIEFPRSVTLAVSSHSALSPAS